MLPTGNDGCGGWRESARAAWTRVRTRDWSECKLNWTDRKPFIITLIKSRLCTSRKQSSIHVSTLTGFWSNGSHFQHAVRIRYQELHLDERAGCDGCCS